MQTWWLQLVGGGASDRRDCSRELERAWGRLDVRRKRVTRVREVRTLFRIAYAGCSFASYFKAYVQGEQCRKHPTVWSRRG